MNARNPSIETGAIVYDTENPNGGIPNPAVVRHVRSIHAHDYFIPELGMTVAEANPEYDPDAKVIVIEFWPSYLEAKGKMYAYPLPRISVIENMWSWFNQTIPEGLREDMKPRLVEFLTAVRAEYETYSMKGEYVFDS